MPTWTAGKIPTAFELASMQNQMKQYAESIRNGSSATTTTTEIIIDSVTWVCPSATYRWRATWVGLFGGTVADGVVLFVMRWAAGASVANTDTALGSITPDILVANKNHGLTLIRTFTGIPAGQVTVGVGIRRFTGTATVSSGGSASSGVYLTVEGAGEA